MADVSATRIDHTTQSMQSKWGWFLVLGIVLILCGALAVALPAVSTFAASVVLGVVLSIAGLVKIIQSLQLKGIHLAGANRRGRTGRWCLDLPQSLETSSCDHALNRAGIPRAGPWADCPRIQGTAAARLALAAHFRDHRTIGERCADIEVTVY